MQFNVQKFLIVILIIASNYQECMASEKQRGRYSQQELIEIRTSIEYYRAPFGITLYQIKNPDLYLESYEIRGLISRNRYRETLNGLKEERLISNEAYS